jgi:hypothetical protein
MPPLLLLPQQKRASERAVGGRPPARKTLRTRPPELARAGAGEVHVASILSCPSERRR